MQRLRSREPGTEAHPQENKTGQAHQDGPQQAAVAELPVCRLYFTTDDGERKVVCARENPLTCWRLTLVAATGNNFSKSSTRAMVRQFCA